MLGDGWWLLAQWPLVVMEQLCDQGVVDQKSSNKSWFSLSGVVW